MSTATASAKIKRADVPKEQTWNRESEFQSWEAYQQEMDAISAELPKLDQYVGKLGDSPDTLVEWLETYFALTSRVYRLIVYVRMAMAVDREDTEAKGRNGQITGLSGKLSAASAFAEPELLTLGDKILEWAKQDERLTIYTHYFESILRLRPHTLSPDVEKVLGGMAGIFEGPFRVYRELTDTDLKFPDALDGDGASHPVTQAIVPPLGIESRDRKLRENAWHSFSDSHRAFENTLAAALSTNIKQTVFLAQTRNYSTALEYRLSPANLPVAVFHTLIDTFKKNVPVWHRYWEAKRKALGVDQLHPYDIWAPLVDSPPHVSYEQAIDWLSAALQPLGDDYVAALRRGALEERWVDYAQNEGRGQGAFSSPSYGNHPFVFNTFDGSLTALSILAHELGHSMHFYQMARHQPPVYNGYNGNPSSAVAETASNFHQAMLRAHLMKEKADDRTFQLALIDEAMHNFHRYFFIMPTLARFELEVYTRTEKDQPLNAPIMNQIMRDLYAEGYGSAMGDDPDRTQITWAEFLHLYIPYYPFQYSVGISAAHALAEGILAGQAEAAENYLKFLQAGWSMDAPDLFKLAGVDMTQPAPIEKTFGVLAQLVERLESLTS